MPEQTVINYTITGASDWPMFKMMLGVLAAMFMFLWAIIAALIGGMWYDLKSRIATQRSEDTKHCSEKHSFVTRELDVLWQKVDELCNKIGISTPAPVKSDL